MRQAVQRKAVEGEDEEETKRRQRHKKPKKPVKPAVDDEGFMGCHTDHWIAKKMSRDVATVRRHLDEAGVPFERIGSQRWYRDEVIVTWMQTGSVPEPRRGRVRRRLPQRVVS